MAEEWRIRHKDENLLGRASSSVSKETRYEFLETLSQTTPTCPNLVQTVGADLDERAAKAVGKGSAAVRVCLSRSSDPKNCFGYMIERRAALFRVVWSPDGMIYDYVSARSAT
ncbi:MAG TPA: hypothetical protein VMS16_15700 [Mycobacterium sp.]|nr:hypothetical protein [Mycobacterium sp.]